MIALSAVLLPQHIMSTTFSYEFESETFTGKVSFPTGVFIDGKFAAGSDRGTIE